MAVKIFSPKMYIKTGAGLEVATLEQDELDIDLAANWQFLDAEVEGKVEEVLANEQKLGQGLFASAGKSNEATFKNVQVTLANWDHIKATYQNVTCSIMLNEKDTVAGTGRIIQVQNIIPNFSLNYKTNDTASFNITLKKAAGYSLEVIEVATLLAT